MSSKPPTSATLGDASELIQRAVALHKQGNLDEATRLCKTILERDAGHFGAQHTLGVIALQRGQFADAIANLEQALVMRPDSVEALGGLANALAGSGRYDEAIACYDGVLAVQPDFVDALNDRGIALLAQGQHSAAIASYDKAISVRPKDPTFYYNRGVARRALMLGEPAIADFDHALAIKPDYAEALAARGHVCVGLGRHDEAAASFAEAYLHAPDFPFLLGYLMQARGFLCDWTDYDETVRRALDGMRSGQPVCVPFTSLALSDDPGIQLLSAKSCVQSQHSKVQPLAWGGRRRAHDRIRVAYLSANFHDHAAGFLIAELFELHDRRRFEITGVSFGPDTQGRTRARLQAGLDRFIDIRAISDADAATLWRDLEIDIAIDMMGHTLDARLDIFAYRPAPIQVNYLGYTGTTGAPFIDYIVADHFVVPTGDDAHYSERVVRLPECFQVTDSTSPVAERTPIRSELGLPEQGFVFCCFNNGFKIKPAMFDLWMRLLQRVDGSVLWLLRSNDWAERNLRREAEKRGIESHRLVFAPKVSIDQYQAQHRVADLFLDTLPYNAHTTAGYALLAGLPVLTCPGKGFAARVAGTQLNALNLPELLCNSLQEYEAKALELATNPPLLQAIKQKLARAVIDAPLFNTDRYRRHLEAAYVTMWEMYTRGEQPRAFDVPRLAT